MIAFRKILSDRRGASSAEYSIVAALIAVAAIGAFHNVGNALEVNFNTVSNKVDTSL